MRKLDSCSGTLRQLTTRRRSKIACGLAQPVNAAVRPGTRQAAMWRRCFTSWKCSQEKVSSRFVFSPEFPLSTHCALPEYKSTTTTSHELTTHVKMRTVPHRTKRRQENEHARTANDPCLAYCLILQQQNVERTLRCLMGKGIFQ